MVFRQFYSGSSGNLYEVIVGNGNRLILEVGVSWKKLNKSLGFDFTNIEAAFATHRHLDHFKESLSIVKAGLDIYASKETLKSQGLLGHRRTFEVENETLVRLKNFEVLCFDTNHDCEGSLGFVVRDRKSDEFLLFATDTRNITQRFKYPFSIIAIECSYDRDVLGKRVESGDINETLAKRLLESHMEWHNTLRYLQDFCDLSKCHEIHLLHLSRDNIDAEYVRSQIEKTTFIETKIKETIVT